MATSLEDLGTITGLVAITRRDNANLIRDLRRAVCLHERGRTQGPGGLGRKRSYVHALAVGSSSWRAVRLTYSEEVRLTVSGAVSTILQWGSFKTRTRLRTSPLFSVYLVELLHLALAEEYVTGIIGDLMSFATGSAGTEDLGLHHAESSRHLGLLIPPLAVPSRMPVEEVRALARSTAIKVDEAVCLPGVETLCDQNLTQVAIRAEAHLLELCRRVRDTARFLGLRRHRARLDNVFSQKVERINRLQSLSR